MVSGVSKFYRLKDNLDHSVPEQNRIEYYFNKDNKFFITEKGFDWFKNNTDNLKINNKRQNSTNNDIVLYQNQVIQMYKERIEYLESENKRLLDIIAFKEQKEQFKTLNDINNANNSISFFERLRNRFRKD